MQPDIARAEYEIHGQEGLDQLLAALDGGFEGAGTALLEEPSALTKVVLARRSDVKYTGPLDPLALLHALQVCFLGLHSRHIRDVKSYHIGGHRFALSASASKSKKTRYILFGMVRCLPGIHSWHWRCQSSTIAAYSLLMQQLCCAGKGSTLLSDLSAAAQWCHLLGQHPRATLHALRPGCRL